MKRDIQILNKKAKFNYSFEEEFSAGIVLTGDEVKSIRNGKVNLGESFVTSARGDLYLSNCNISGYEYSSIKNYNPTRNRKLLLHKKQIRYLIGKLDKSGLSLIPLKIYESESGFIKVQLGLGKGKTSIDKRQTIKDRDWAREKAQLLKNKI